MKILVVSELLPSRAGGGTSRHFNLIRELSDQHEIHVITRAYPEDRQSKDGLDKYIRSLTVINVPMPSMPKHSKIYWLSNAWFHALFDPKPLRGRDFNNSQFTQAVNQRIMEEHFDLIQIHQAYMADGIDTINCKTVLDMHDVLSEYERRLIGNQNKVTHKILAWLEWKKMLRFERSVIRKSDLTLTVSEHDRKLLHDIYGSDKVSVVPNGVDIEYYQPQPVDPLLEKSNIIFIGTMGYFPNEDGILWFHKEIYPFIKSHANNVHLFVVGRNPTNEVMALNDDPTITVTGFVDDIRPFMKQSAVFIVPLRYGSGTRLKILDAWAMAKAVISTSIGAEGLDYKSGEDILISDIPEAFAKNVLDLLTNPGLRQKLGEAGRKKVELLYSWKSIGEKLSSIYCSISKA